MATKSNLTVRIPEVLQERLRELAKQSGKSLNKTAEEVIKDGVLCADLRKLKTGEFWQ